MGYNDTNHSGKEVEDSRNISNLELIYNCNDPHTFLHYNGTKSNPDLLLASADLSQSTKRSVLEDPGSGHREILAEISFPVKNRFSKHKSPRLKNQTPQTAKRPFRINQKIISSNAKVAGYFLKYFTEANRKGAYAREMSRAHKRQLGPCRDRSEDLPENVKEYFLFLFLHARIKYGLNGLKNRKSPGVDNIHPEFLRHLGQTAKSQSP
ncbi:uncharacterized protein LOC103523941 [Caerostris extrusa]|uniref:Uncharacterized protein LOC103523941 n=1 Tax=Caerostris extrusa TaxID=172846 RepID=A0AAV4MG11_CAEEX|nr:uncharacterized protein LOC103523941 [Caerostris extrusa]